MLKVQQKKKDLEIILINKMNACALNKYINITIKMNIVCVVLCCKYIRVETKKINKYKYTLIFIYGLEQMQLT